MKRVLPEPAIRISLQCDACGFRWDVAEQQPGTWWGKKVTAEKIAPMCWCPKCSATPPTIVDMR